MSDLQNTLRKWLADVLDTKGMTANALAKAIGRSPTTLTRFLNQADHKSTLNMNTVHAIATATGMPVPAEIVGRTNAVPAPGELDGLELSAETGDLAIDDVVRHLCHADANLSPWRLNTRALEGLGYLPGDVVIVDQAAQAENGDVVVAQVYKQRGAETIFRVYAKPFLTSVANDRIVRAPLLVDEDRVAIRGAVIAMFRPRRGHLYAA